MDKGVGNVDRVCPRKEVIKYNVNKKDNNIGRKRSYADIVIHRNKRWHKLGT